MLFSTPSLFLLFCYPVLVSAHGYLSYPPPRGEEKVTYNIDSLKSPNLTGEICRGEPEGKITTVAAGSTLVLQFTITAPHKGPCTVELLDLNLGNSISIGEKYNCADVGMVGPWPVKIPDNVSGRKVLHWHWEGRQNATPEEYDQCSDLMITGGSGGGGNDYDDGKGGRQDDSGRKTSRSSGGKPTNYNDGKGGRQDDPGRKTNNSSGRKPTEKPETYGNDNHLGPSSDQQEVQKYSVPKGAADETEDPSEPPPYDRGDTASGGSCTNGKYECGKGPNFAICQNGSWIQQACGAGSKCVPQDGSIICGLA